MHSSDTLTLGLAQLAPVWLNRTQTLDKMLSYAQDAATQSCDLVIFGEALLPGYPFWLELTDGARFNSKVQKEIHAHYMANAVCLEQGHLDSLCTLAKQHHLAMYVGIIERPLDRGGHSLYCSLVYIDADGHIASVHRKLMPTYEERLSWSIGDGHGLQVHSLGAFQVGGLNCWENWMPLARAALYALGEDLHVAVWPGSQRNTDDLTRFIAKESRSFVVSVSGLMRRTDIPAGTPHSAQIIDAAPEVLANGGSCLATPDGSWVIAPFMNEEKLVTATINHAQVRQERQNFDPAGHYARPDVTQLIVNRKRQSTLTLLDGD
ncbi:MAG: carbon-nitrogen hydrolase family protein [Deinococcota bacterium]